MKAALPDGFDHTDRLVIITDCRFENEAERARALGGYLTVVRGPGETEAWEHLSEKPLDVEPDFVIRNEVHTDGFADLDRQIRDMLLVYSERARDEA